MPKSCVYEQHGDAAIVAHLLQEAEGGVAHGGVEAGGGLVGDDHARLEGGGSHGDHHALRHAAGELVREGAGDGLGIREEAAERRDGPLLCLGLVGAVRGEDLGDLVADAERRRERGLRVLEDHRDLGAAERAQGVLVLEGDRHPGVLDRAVLDAGVGGQQAEQRQRDRGLARAGLADERERLARVELEAAVADRLDARILGPVGGG